MPVIYACVLPHPPLAVPAVGCGEERKVQKTLDAYDKIAMKIREFANVTDEIVNELNDNL
jgi:hypothetical protein